MCCCVGYESDEIAPIRGAARRSIQRHRKCGRAVGWSNRCVTWGRYGMRVRRTTTSESLYIAWAMATFSCAHRLRDHSSYCINSIITAVNDNRIHIVPLATARVGHNHTYVPADVNHTSMHITGGWRRNTSRSRHSGIRTG